MTAPAITVIDTTGMTAIAITTAIEAADMIIRIEATATIDRSAGKISAVADVGEKAPLASAPPTIMLDGQVGAYSAGPKTLFLSKV